MHARRFGTCLVMALLGVLIAVPTASASQIVGRNARDVRLKINNRGIALVTWRDPRGFRKVLAWGAMNARHPSPTVRQVKFRLDYTGGSYSFGAGYWKRFKDASGPYDGPPLPWLVAARKAPDGSYWALQAWRRLLPNYGYRPWNSFQRAWELRLSHWSTEPAKLEIWTDWVDRGRSHHLFGRYTYLGVGVHGYGATPTGSPTDSYGRNVYVDTYNSAYGSGWQRENSFLTHRPNGNFCYGFYVHRGYDGRMRPKGNGAQYRATVIGPGVTPDVMWTAPGLPNYDPDNPQHVAHENEMNALGRTLIANDPDDKCTAQ